MNPREMRPWTHDELAQAVAWRGLPSPPTYAEIGRRLGGRSEQSVRLKLYDERMKAKRGGNRPLGFPRAERLRFGPDRRTNRDAALVAACRRDGGFSAFSSQRLRGAVFALCRPVIGAGGIARPMGWRDGKPEALRSEADEQHLRELARWWKERDRAAREGRGAEPAAPRRVAAPGGGRIG